MKIGLYQFTSVYDYQVNLKKVNAAAIECQKQGAITLFLPECFYSMSDGLTPTEYLVDDKNEHYENIQSIAINAGITIIGGSAATKKENSIVNRAYNFSSSGKDLGFYDKRCLFSCDLGKSKKIDEADIYTAGIQSKIIDVEQLKIGLGICFDVRFPRLGQDYRDQGVNLLTYSSAFTIPTGKAHWHTLLRARAIENQCFVVACAQWGKNNNRTNTYGHSLIVDPWGNILVDAKEGESLHFCEIDLSLIERNRKMIKLT